MFTQIATCLQSNNIEMLSIGFLDQGDQLYVLMGHLPNEALSYIQELVAKIRAKEIEVNRSYDDNNQKLYSVIVERDFNVPLGVMANAITIQVHNRPTRSIYLD